jgi:rod shape-determining protein MreC
MESFFSRYKNALVLILVLFAQVIGVAIQVRRPLPQEHAQPDAGGVRLIRYWAISLVSPPERLVHWVGSSILGLWDNYLDLIHVRQQNKDLQAELHRLRIEQGGIVEDARQGQRLQQLLAFQEKYVYKTLPAQIIGTSGTDQSRILYLDKGAKEGVAVDMPVITPDGIVGRVREVFPHKSQVLEITDPTSGAGVILATTRVRGILRGNALGQPQVVNVMPDDRIKAGEAVVTSGGDQIFPRGLAVGYVDRVVADPERDPLVDVLIRPAANLSRLEEVLIITNVGDQVTPREKLDLIQSQAIANAEQLKASEVLAERLPGRIDPDAPKSEDDNPDNSQASAADGGISRPLRPPTALHPDRFTPNTTPPATNLTPGARAAAQAEGHGNTTASTPKPHAAVAANGDTADAAAGAPKKKTDLVPDDGSRPPAVMAVHPLTPADATVLPSKPTVSGESTETATRPAAAKPDIDGAESPAPAAHSAVTQGSPEAGASPAASKPAAPKTTVIVDGPLRPSVKKAAPPASATPAQHVPAATAPHPATTSPAATTPHPATTSSVQHTPAASPQQQQHAPATPTQHPATAPATPAQHPATTSPAQRTPAASTQQHAPTTPAQRPATAPAQRKGPELVPDDGSRPPATMRPNPPKPQPPPQTTQQPQGGRG